METVLGQNFKNGVLTLDKHHTHKYYGEHKNVKIQLIQDEFGTPPYFGPFFKIKNNSHETFYGEYLPGYFWGTLSYIRNDSILRTSIGHIDTDFIDSPPLYPKSTKIATVGSFGLSRKLKSFEYRFEVLLKKKYEVIWNIYKEQPNFVWEESTNEYFKLKYDFKVDEESN